MMEIILGPFPRDLVYDLCESSKYFHHTHVDYPLPETDVKSIHFCTKLKSIEQLVKPRHLFAQEFLDLLRYMLQYRASRRITAIEALNQPFFK